MGRVRVVVTGMGAVTALGTTVGATWGAVRAGHVGIAPMTRPMEGFGTAIGAEVPWRVRPRASYRRPRGHREPAIDYALIAAEEALASSFAPALVPPDRWGVVIGTCNAGLISGELWFVGRLAGRKPPDEMLLLVPPQALAEAVSGAFGMMGPVLSVNTACAAGANALGYAADLIRSGRADAVLAGGADALSDVVFAGFTALESLSPTPAAPYSRHRLGLSLGEGSGMLVLTREDIALAAGSPVLAEIAGYGLSADGYHPTAPQPEGEGAARAMRAALEDAGIGPEEVVYVNGHGTGTPKNDSAETHAIRAALGDVADRVLVSSTKSQIGHLLGAAGAVEAIVTVKALEDQVAPPTANFIEADPECDLDYVPNMARPIRGNVALTNNFAFGGANACVVLSRGRDGDAPSDTPAERVVVTGLAVLAPGAADPGEAWDRWMAGPPHPLKPEGDRVRSVDFDPSPQLTVRDRRRMDRLGILAVSAAKLALVDGGLEIDGANRARIGVVFGTGIGPMESMEAFVRPLVEEGFEVANPAVFPNTVYNAAGGLVAIHTGAVGPASTVTTGHAAGAAAIAYGGDLAAAGKADAVLCVAADAHTETVISGYRALGALEARTGSFVLSEAGIGLLVERLDRARARGAQIYGELLGHGMASDGLGVGRFDPRGRGLERAMEIALERAGIVPQDVTSIWAATSGIRAADRAEATAIRRVFGTRPRIHAPKGVFGEPMGAGGALNAALALVGRRRTGEDGPALVNSSSMGGTHISLILGPAPQA